MEIKDFFINYSLVAVSLMAQIAASFILLIKARKKTYNPKLLYFFVFLLICVISPSTIYNSTFSQGTIEYNIQIILLIVSILILIISWGLNINEKKGFSLTSKNITRISILLGSLMLFANCIFGYLAYNDNKKVTMERFCHNNITKAEMIEIFFDTKNIKYKDRKFFQYLQIIWSKLKSDENINLSIIDKDGKLLFNTEGYPPDLYLGDINVIFQNQSRTIQDIILKKENFRGESVNHFGQKLLSSYVYDKKLDVIISVYIQKKEVELETYTNTLPWILGFVYITIVLLPLSLLLFNRAYKLEKVQNLEIQKTLQDSEEKFRQMAENINQVFWVFDTNQEKFIYLSPAYEKVFFTPSKDVYEVPEAFLTFVHEEDQAMLEKVVDDKNHVETEFRVIAPDKSIKWLTLKASPIKDKNDNVYRMVGISEDITERKIAEEKIRASLEEKEILLKEIHHRVKNNLQVIYSLLGLQTHYIKDEKYINILKESQQRVKSMAMIHEKLYQSKDLNRIDFYEYLDSLLNYLFSSYQSNQNYIKIEKYIDRVFLDIDTAIPCGLIINELFSNALKHAFSDIDNGIIKVYFHNKKENFILIIKDNGVGLSNDFDIKKSKTLGLKLVNTLVKQIDGNINVSFNNGTEFKIMFPNKLLI